ncbi:hypothetical protein ABW19_dt0202728 [Dactylella cylindrospora]|nr:hypothetical protein ABW19_dt0202728 [Dactylella cylindrospora]
MSGLLEDESWGDNSSDRGADSSPGGEPITHAPSPPPTPPSIKFDPPLSIQRQVKVWDLLKAAVKEYDCPIQSLLDVGCGGNAPLIQNLLPCDDELPLSLLSGIDIDEDLFSVGAETAFTKRDYGDDDRWRDLTVSLFHGSFEDISPQGIGEYDAITSCEVIEHLDPDPLSNFAPVLLGRMNPKVLVVTTPNRDFNSLFEMPFESLPDTERSAPHIWDPHDDPAVAGRRFYREPHKYAMRHDDHRFEWTRTEFKEWGDNAAETYGYTVEYHGCGALRDGAQILAARWKVEKALRDQMKSQNMEVDERESITTALLMQAFGHCSQVAIFIRNNLKKKLAEAKESPEERLYTKPLPDIKPAVAAHIVSLQNLPIPLRLVRYHTFNKVLADRAYPPSLLELFDLQRLPLKLLLPVEVQRIWQEQLALKRYEKYDYPMVVLHTDLNTLWEASYAVQRACRFHFKVFEHLMNTKGPDTILPAKGHLERGALELDIIKDKQDEKREYTVVNLALEPIREYQPSRPYTELQEGSDFEYSPEEDPPIDDTPSSIEEPASQPPSNRISLTITSTSPIITSKILWSPNSSGQIPEEIYLPVETLRTVNTKSEILILNEPIASLEDHNRMQKRRLKSPQTGRDPAAAGAEAPALSLPLSAPVILGRQIFGDKYQELVKEGGRFEWDADEATWENNTEGSWDGCSDWT